MNTDISLFTIIDELRQVAAQVDEKELKVLEQAIIHEKRIFVTGEGRSGFIGQCFAMRLMHLGFFAYVVGETITPSFTQGDVLVCISGSGETDAVVLSAQKAQKAGMEIISVTTNKASTLAKLSAAVIQLNAATRDTSTVRHTVQLLGSLFDQSVHIVFDYVCLLVSKAAGISNEEATQNHV